VTYATRIQAVDDRAEADGEYAPEWANALFESGLPIAAAKMLDAFDSNGRIDLEHAADGLRGSLDALLDSPERCGGSQGHIGVERKVGATCRCGALTVTALDDGQMTLSISALVSRVVEDLEPAAVPE
jgi:hypothetical protein